MEWIFIAVIAVAMVAMMVVSGKRNKKSQASYMDMLNSLEKGDKVYLTSRIVGVVVKVVTEPDGQKFIVVESGEGENKSNFLVDVQAVYMVLSKANAPVVKSEDSEQVFAAESTESTESVAEASEPEASMENTSASEEVTE